MNDLQNYLEEEGGYTERSRTRGTSVQQLHDNLTLSTIDESLTNSSENVCIVCLREYEEGDIIRKINNCSHYFHTGCIERWLCQHDCCPTCRCNVTRV